MRIAATQSYHRIETVTFLRGRPITSYYSFPLGVNVEKVREIDARLVQAFGNVGSQSVATPFP
jgi:hypothetical protein